MSEAVFNISADIVPEIDDRELERQATLLSKQLNGLLAKNIKKVDVAPNATKGSFKPFQQQINAANNLVDKFHQTVQKLPITQVAKAGSSAFLKFTDLIDVSRRDLVGYGKSMFDTIRNTRRFRDSMEGVKDSLGAIGDLPQRFQFLSAQIRSGTSVIDRMAERGDRLATLFQPLVRIGESSRTEFVELNRSIDLLSNTVRGLGSQANKVGSVVQNQFGQPIFDKQIKSVESLGDLLKDTPILFDKLKGSVQQALNTGTKAGLVKELVDMKNEAQKVTGPLGRVAQFINEKSKGKFFPDNTKAARELAIELEQGAISKIKELGAANVLGPIERLNATLRSIRDTTKTVIRVTAPLRAGFARFGEEARASLSSVGNSIASTLLGKLPQFSNEALTAEERMKKFLTGASNLDIAFDRIQTSINKTVRSLGQFLGKNVTGPLTQMGSDIKKAFAAGPIQGFQQVLATLQGPIDVIQRGFIALQTRLQAFANTPFAKNITGALAGVNNALNAVGRGVRDTAVTLATEFGKTAVVAFEPVKQSAIQAFNFVARQGKTAFSAVFEPVKQSAIQAFGFISRQGSTAFTSIRSAIGDLANDAKGAGILIKDAFAGSSIGPQSLRAFSAVRKALSDVANDARGAGVLIKNAFSGGGGSGGGGGGTATAGAGLAERFAAARDRASELVRTLSLAGSINLSAIGNSLTDSLDKATERVGRLSGAINTNLGKALTFVADGSLTTGISNFFSNIQNIIKTRSAALRASQEQSGSELVSGLIMGIDRGKPGAFAKMRELAQGARDALRKVLRIHSPSETEVQDGQDTARGFAKGVDQGKSAVQKSMQGIGGIVKSLSSQFAGLAKTAFTVTGVALAGLGAVALRSGIEFNTLQQVINGTLPVLVGSKAAAAGLLKEINELNNSSPFARSSFLQLTQTLAGFGVQAKKIKPLIDAIQQTVAATGGGEGDLQELGGAFAKIQSQGRLSLDILQSFSVRGVDAIGILGQSFGKTTSEVRDMISNGLVPAGKAIDALTTGLKTRFDGATEAVSKNLPGALDRIKGKLRDMGAELTRAFVNPEGGGALVNFLNSISSAMVHINKDLLPPIRPLLEVVALGFTSLGKAIQTFVLNIQSSAIPGFIDRMASIAPTLGFLVGFFPKVFEFIPVIGPKLALLGGPITGLILGLGALALQSGKVREALRPIIDNVQTLFKVIVPVISNVLPKLQELFAALVVAIAPLIADIAAGLIPLVIKIGEVIGVWAEKLKPVVAAIGEFVLSLRPAVALAFQFLQGLLNVAQASAGPIATGLVKIAQLLTRIAPLINALIVRMVVMKGIGAIIAFINGGFLGFLNTLVRLAAGIPIVSTALTGLGISATGAAAALNSVLGVAGLIAAGIALFIQLKGHSDKSAESLDRLGDAGLSLKEKFKIAFDTKDMDAFAQTLAELQAKADSFTGPKTEGPAPKNAFEAAAANSENPAPFDARNAFDAAEAAKNLAKQTDKQADAIKRATEAGQKGQIVEFQSVVNAKKNGEFLVKDVAFRNELNAAVLKGAENQVHANAVAEESQGILTKLSDKLKAGKLHQTDLQAAAEASAAAIKDKYMEANKAVQDANAALSGAIDSLKQGLSTIDSKLNAVFTAAKNAQDASKAITTAREKETEINKDLAKTQDDYTKALRDAIEPVDELNKALREQTRVKNSIRDLDQELEKLTDDDKKLQEDRLKLTGQEAADDRAGLVRAEQRAQISLNQAKQAELDLLNELNGANKVSINLAGLSLDQIRAKLAAARLSSPRERKKTAQEIADAKESANLDVQDATQAKKDATQAKADFEIDTKQKIKDIDVSLRENDERRAELLDDRLDKLLDEKEAQKTVNKLREGETTQAAIIKDFDEKIRDAKERQKDAAEAITTAVKAEALAKAELVEATATIRGDTVTMATAQQTIWNLKMDGLNNLDPKTLTAIQTQKNQVSQLLEEYQKITAEVQRTIKLQTQASDFQKAGIALGSFETLSAANTADLQAGRGQNPITLANIERTKKDVLAGIRAAIEAGGAENKSSKTPFIPQGNQTNLIMAAINSEFMKPNANLRDAIARALNSFGLSMPGFAAARGLSPGMIHPGMHNGKGLVRMFEFGKEAVLPLTRPQDMSRIVNDPRVLPSVMKALPGFARGFAPGDDIIMHALATPNSSLRKLLQDLFRQMGLQFPGFAEGYAPGDLSTGSLGSFKPFSVSDFAGSSLSPVLNALPRWSMPQSGAQVSLDSSTSSDLSTVVRSARTAGGRPANADVYEKKSQRAFANTIGEAVRTAVKSAIEESGGLGGDDIDIHVNPNASETQRAIAREVKRQLDKRTGKW